MVKLALPLFEHRHDGALDYLLEVRRAPVRLERGLIGIDFIKQEQVGVLGRSICMVERSARL
jgi:hypothetical protein